MVENRKIDKVNFYTNLIYFIVVVGFVVIRILCSVFASQIGVYGSYIISIVTQVGLLFLLPFLLFKWLNKAKTKETFKFFSYKKISFKSVLVAVALGVIVFFLNVYVSSFFNSLIQLFGYKPSTSTTSLPATWWVFLLNLLCTAILPAICEETLHRGMLLKGNSNLGMKKSILIAGLLFGLLHLNIEQFFYATIIGLFLGYICWCTSSIYPCIIVHFMNNAISVFLSFARAKGWAIGTLFSYISEFLTANSVLGLVMFILFLCLLVMLAIEATKFLIKDSFNYNFVAKQKQLTSMFIRQAYFNDVENIKNQQPTNVKDVDYAGRHVVYIDLKDFMDFVDKNMKNIFDEVEKIETEKQESQDQTAVKSKIFLYGAIALSAIVTIMTFIWGLL